MPCKINFGVLVILLSSIFGINEGFCTTDQRVNIDKLFETQQKLNQQLNSERLKPELFIFISFSMPERSLKEWAKQAKKVKATLLLRGFHQNSLQKTTAKLMTIIGKDAETEWKIDPESYQHFQIKAVPSVVVVSENNNFDIAYGDISLETALGKFALKGTPEIRKTAQEFLEKYRMA